VILLSHRGGGSPQEEEGKRVVNVVIAILAIIGGIAAVYGLAVTGTIIYMIYKFLKEGDG
jgi:hypothetical protein